MDFKIDENLPVETADILRQAGHDALTVIDQGMSGESDSSIARVCQIEARVLITLDLDFADIRSYPPHLYPGLIVLRSKRQDKITVTVIVERVVEMLHHEPIYNRLWIVDEDRVRIRE